MQKTLAAHQVSAFYHDGFVRSQVKHFESIAMPILNNEKVVVDIGGGVGHFAKAIKDRFNIDVRVIDTDPIGVDSAKKLGVDAVIGDALRPLKKGDEGVACFNLILHHLVGSTERETLQMQVDAITAWKSKKIIIFINEYIYDSWFRNIAGWLIYQITKSKGLSAICRLIARFIPSLRANTFGVGVRFRGNQEWRNIFENSGFAIMGEVKGERERVSIPMRLLLIKEIRRDSFVLVSSKCD
jgi:hypothetical protein